MIRDKRGFYINTALITAIITFFYIVPPITAQERITPMTEDNFLTSGFYGGGLTFIDGDAYVRIQLQPEIPLGKFGLGFDLVLLYNPYAENSDDQFLAEDGESWDSLSTWLRLIRYFSYAEPYDPFYFRVGEFDYLTIGHGSIMSGYSNHDRRGLHLNLRKDDNQYGIETMVNDLGHPTIFGARGFYRPFQKPENNNIITRFELGATYITDIEPNTLSEDGEPLNTIGVDVGFPIIESSSFRFDLYNDFAVLNPPPNINQIQEQTTLLDEDPSSLSGNTSTNGVDEPRSELAWGNAVGIGLAATKAIFKFEYRIFGDGYIPAVFDYTYESGMTEFWGYEQTNDARRGFYTQIIWQPMPQLQLLTAFETYTNNTSKLYLGVKEAGLIPRLAFRAFYAKRNIGEDDEKNFFSDLFDLDEKSALNLEIRYAIFPPVETIFINEYRFRRIQTDDGTYQFEPIHKTSIMVGVSSKY